MRGTLRIVVCSLAALAAAQGLAAAPGFAEVRPLLATYCLECHTGEAAESSVDLAAFASLDDARRAPQTFQRVARVLAAGDMPPRDAAQPTAAERALLAGWLESFLAAEAAAHAGDPGPVVLRRLSNAEYTYTVRDLTGVDSLDPAREFPVDGAAGEGFTNVGQALVMSPSLVTKYLDAAKGIAGHAVPMPDGIRFSASDERGDWIDEALARLRGFYARYTVARKDIPTASAQGVQVDAGHEGFLPIERYLEELFAKRQQLRDGGLTIGQLAAERGLSAKYLALVWRALEPGQAGAGDRSLLLDRLRALWAAGPTSAAAITAEVFAWQKPLWRFNRAGQIARQYGRVGGRSVRPG